MQVHNLYGPTEASVGVSHFKVTKDNASKLGTVVPIGRPFDYVTFCVFDPSSYSELPITEDNLVPTSGIGELFIGGDCLATGYMKNAEKTNMAFFNFPKLCPRASGAPYTLYKTGWASCCAGKKSTDIPNPNSSVLELRPKFERRCANMILRAH